VLDLEVKRWKDSDARTADLELVSAKGSLLIAGLLDA
jgi:hypothetical protein